ncbi:Sco1-family protein [Thecamonas trahens ATCC 50062]|uniref:Sco1-family protein n=1 Tax=Thecamonas trahens ATCC 50062 TaxID=461836 RepID=A0A0L0DN18_THETB|nr:Sco1-family protein [Thecamonas trahens ATCC 50062]KNC53704.1 Sco1-family protein [Thecamonas trahens ATCC 50062]|eukprot:XP_013762018.1 Sco1-family protein [Thecamonas trahens ATCC 50062]
MFRANYARAVMASLALGSGVVGLYAYERHRMEKTETIVGEADLGGEFELMDTDGEVVKSDDLLGKYLLIYFGFTHCPDICPTEMHKMSSVLAELRRRKSSWGDAIVPLFITIDPKRDTPQAIGKYLAGFDPAIRGLTGSPEQTEAAAKAYKVFSYPVPSAEGDDDDDYLIDHSIFIFLVGPDGKYKAHFGYDKSVAVVTDGVAAHLPRQWWEFWL